jgi:hypothetical protein
VNGFVVENVSISEDKSVTIIGYPSSIPESKLMFYLEPADDSYIIIKTKGLSYYYKSNLYEYCRRIGCFGIEPDDIAVSQTCESKEKEYKALIQKIKRNIEDNFILESHTIEHRGFVSDYLAGKISMKNNSRFSIPKFTYDIYVIYLTQSGDIVLKSKMVSYENIPYSGSIDQHVFEDNLGGASKVKVELKLTDTDFIEELIVKYVEGENCISKDL